VYAGKIDWSGEFVSMLGSPKRNGRAVVTKLPAAEYGRKDQPKVENHFAKVQLLQAFIAMY